MPTDNVVRKKNRYSKPLISSVLLHIAIITFMLISVGPAVLHLASEATTATSKSDLTPIVEATTIDQAQVLAEVNRLQAQRKAVADAKVAKQKKIQDELASALKTKQQQQQKLAQLEKQKKRLQQEKAKQDAMRKKQAAALAKLKKQQAMHDKEIADIKAKNAKARKVAATVEREKKARQRAEAKAKELEQKNVLAKQKIAVAAKARQQAETKAKAAAREADAAKVREAKRQAQLAKQQQRAQAAKVRHESIVNKFAMQIRNVIESNWMYPRNASKRTCLLALSLSPSGQVLDARLVRSSGDASIDRLAIAAVYKSSPLPVPHNPDDFAPFRQINLTISTHG